MDVPRSMRAAFIRVKGGPELIEFGMLPVPSPGPTDVLVAMEASEVNHVDLFVRSGEYQTHTPFPFVIGRDLVGTIVETGSGVDGFRVGDRMWSNSLGHAGRQGSFAEYAVVPADRCYPLPDGVDPLSAAAVLHTAATAHIGLFRRARLQTGETVFVGGAGGGVGSALVQIAAASGAKVIAAASARDTKWCLACGATEVLDHHLPDLYERVGELVPEGVDIWWDASGHHDFGACLPLVRPGGAVVVMAGMGASPVLPVGALYTRDLSLHGFAISNASVDDLAGSARLVNELLAQGRLQARIAEVVPLAEAARAHQMMAEAKVPGRILVQP